MRPPLPRPRRNRTRAGLDFDFARDPFNAKRPMQTAEEIYRLLVGCRALRVGVLGHRA
jgi:hypothetical protein